MKIKILLIIILSAFFFSCMTSPKNIAYLQNLDKYQQKIHLGSDSMQYEPVIKKYDELLITVTAPDLDQASVAQFNLPMTVYMTPVPGEGAIQQSPSFQTYIVDHDGNIDYPVIGQMHLAGLTKSQAIEYIQKSVSNYIKHPVINLKIMSFKVTVLGEVLKPGTVSVSQEKISIFDAIGAVGDLTIYGNRKNVLLIRENNDGTLSHFRIDLTSSDLFNSPYYYLQQDDKIIVEPNKSRQLDSKYGIADGYRLSTYSTIFGALSIIGSVITVILAIKK